MFRITKDLITGNELFGNLYYRIKELYQEYKNNSIVDAN